MPDTLILLYVGVSLVVGGVAATIETWSPPTMLDRADGRGKFPSPPMKLGEALVFGAFVAIFWPILALGVLLDRIAKKLR
jgi:hypothetical protein